MTTQDIANRLVELCREGNYDAAHAELFASNAVSIEPEGAPLVRAEGIDAIKEKGKMFQEAVAEIHGGYVSDPIVAGKYISLSMGMDVTMKDGTRNQMDEVCLYEVKDGKIVTEQFFF